MISIYQSYKDGRLDLAIKLGIVKPSTIQYLKVYEIYLQNRNIGHNYTEAVMLTAEQIPTSETTVKRAIAEVI